MKYRVTIHYNGQIYSDNFKTIKQVEKFLIYCDTKMLLNMWTLCLKHITIDKKNCDFYFELNLKRGVTK